MARKRRGRPVNGILVLDKPPGRSSNHALQTVKRLYGAAKAGHTGALDPLATGVLPLCFGEATKFSQFLLDADKAYTSTFTLGQRTTTSDSEGEVVERVDASGISRAQVEAALQQFRGEIEQIPSMFSAIKHNGQPLYKLARQGIEIERKVRTVRIHSLRLLAFRPGEYPQVDVSLECSKGTYVRSIAEDLGAALAVGGHVSKLHRTKAGPFTQEMAVQIATIEGLRECESYTEMDALLQPIDAALGDLPLVQVTESGSFYLRQGQPVLVPGAPTEGVVRVAQEDGVFLGIGEILDDGRVAPRRLIVT